MERVRNRRAMERAWRRQELTESVVMRTVGTLAGEPGLRKHWDDPLRAAAEQAAAKVASEEGIAATSETARAAARRAAAAAARLVDAELLSSDGDSPEGLRFEAARNAPTSATSPPRFATPSGSPRYPPTGSTSTREKTDRAGSNPTTARPATKAKISTTAKVSTTTSTAISRANSPSSTPRTPARHLARARASKPRASKPRVPRRFSPRPRDGDDRV